MSLKLIYIILLIGITATWSGPTPATGPQIRSEAVKIIYQSLPGQIRKSLEEAEFPALENTLLYSLKPLSSQQLTVRPGSAGDIEHLGIYMIRRENHEPYYEIAFDFIERTFLEYLLSGNSAVLTDTMSHKWVLRHNGFVADTPAKLPRQLILKITERTPCTVLLLNRNFSVTWEPDSQNKISLTFPRNLYQITSLTKRELEEDLITELKSSHEVAPAVRRTPTPDELQHKTGNLYVLKGRNYQYNQKMNSDQFYLKTNTITPAFSQQHYIESASNLFHNLIRKPKNIILNCRLYGGREEKVELEISRLLGSLPVECQTFVGWQDTTAQSMKMTVIFHNQLYDYTHMLVVSTHTGQLFSEEPLSARFFAFIPQNNL